MEENGRDGDDDLSSFVRVDFLNFSFGFGMVLKVVWLVELVSDYRLDSSSFVSLLFLTSFAKSVITQRVAYRRKT